MSYFTPSDFVWLNAYFSYPAAIDNEILRGAHTTVVGSKEQYHAGDVGRVEPVGKALTLIDLAIAFRREPQFHLALRHHPARQDAIDPDLFRPEFARKGSCKPA